MTCVSVGEKQGRLRSMRGVLQYPVLNIMMFRNVNNWLRLPHFQLAYKKNASKQLLQVMRVCLASTMREPWVNAEKEK
jgi:hypothetical protein